MLKGGCFCGRVRYEAVGTPFHETNWAIVLSVVEPAALRSSRGSAYLGLSSGSCAASPRGLGLLRKARGVFVLNAALS
jgi:hypothetical protein